MLPGRLALLTADDPLRHLPDERRLAMLITSRAFALQRSPAAPSERADSDTFNLGVPRANSECFEIGETSLHTAGDYGARWSRTDA